MSALQIIISAVLAVLVLAGISMMSKVRTAVAGNLLSAFAMLCGIVGTLFFAGVVSVWTIYVSILIGALIGSLLAARVQMIQMPQTVALFNGLGGGASALVGLLSVHGDSAFVRFTALLAVAVGMVTLVGSLIAAGKLHRILPQKPVVWKGHALCTLLFLVLTLAFVVAGTFAHGAGLTVCLVGAFVSASLFGLWFSLRVGGADMPITISLLNSLSGVAGSIAGMAIGDVFLVAVGGIVGASGLLLTQIMCRAMNRKLMSILTGGTMKPSNPTPAIEENENEELVQRIMDLEKKIKELEAMVADLEARVQALDGQLNAAPAPAPVAAPVEEAPTAASVLSKAKDVIIVPGYGMALAQAQHQVRQLADKLESRGARVRFAIHPVAGRMPGHMNVLLAEADVDYEKLYEMDAINDDFKNADAVVVIGANDVLNPAARNAVGTPIYGMPVLNVDQAPEVIVCNFDLKPGYAGVENPIYTREKGVYLELGDAKETLMRLMAGIA
ncbi:MAG: NAD(P)(+) transhydrogenase (Re/Si-specific) subunit beta [Bacteroidales bacterium]|nr:NAD(P)(+) transhydrogenase (Re/Si-specific) subunit beta [Bacteroidales bacterium]